jgi:hypothetical protein
VGPSRLFQLRPPARRGGVLAAALLVHEIGRKLGARAFDASSW